MKLRVQISEIDYSAIAEKIMPIVTAKIETMERGIKKSALQATLNTGVANEIFAILPQKIKNGIAVKIIEETKVMFLTI